MQEANLSLFMMFHLNMAYSSITEEQRLEVIDKCYWPLLRMIEDNSIPIAIEASAFTLDSINYLCPEWLQSFKKLCMQKKSELIGSGYCQIIGPLVPAAVNAANLNIANVLYNSLLEIQPNIAFINEQAWSRGILDTYIDHNYDTVIMEWNNPNFLNPSWPSDTHYHPQKVLGHSGRPLNLIWNDSIIFQKFQRVIHQELSQKDLVNYLKSHLGNSVRCLSLYGNDAEIFNFRPGRFETESTIKKTNEWQTMTQLLNHLQHKEWIEFVLPSAILKPPFTPEDNVPISLSTASVPIPVKKQNKYNAVRWAVSGRNDFILNTYCQQLYTEMQSIPLQDPQWKKLCYFWSSDFRTHITIPRYTALLLSLKEACTQNAQSKPSTQVAPPKTARQSDDGDWLTVKRHPRHLEVSTAKLQLVLKTTKGLAIKSLKFDHISDQSLLGTIEHGFFEDMNYAADFFSGHLTADSPGQHQLTDLYPTEPVITVDEMMASITCQTLAPKLKISKTFTIFRQDSKILLDYDISFNEKPQGTVRLGYITLNPKCFDPSSLFFATHNGGQEMETFPLGDEAIHHFSPISSLISAQTCLGITENVLHIGDSKKFITLQIDKTVSNCVGGIQYIPMGNTYLLRHIFSAMEHDDTRLASPKDSILGDYSLKFSLTISATQALQSETNLKNRVLP